MRILIISSLILTACSGVNAAEKLGIKLPKPDEFQLRQREALAIPSSFDLPEPATRKKLYIKEETSHPINHKNLSEGESAILDKIN